MIWILKIQKVLRKLLMQTYSLQVTFVSLTLLLRTAKLQAQIETFPFQFSMLKPEMIRLGVVTIDVSSIGIKFENFMQADCRDQGLHCWRTVYCQKLIILPKLVLIFGTFLELPVLPSIICGCIPIWLKYYTKVCMHHFLKDKSW